MNPNASQNATPSGGLTDAQLAGQRPNLARRNTWVMYSPTEAAASDDDAGFWSGHFGWTTKDCATVYIGAERYLCRPPIANDIVWRNRMELALVDAVLDLGKFDMGQIDDSVEYSAIELQGVTVDNGVCHVCDEDPQFYGMYLRGTDGTARHAGDFWSYEAAFDAAMLLARAWKLPVTRTPGNMDQWFLLALNQATSS